MRTSLVLDIYTLKNWKIYRVTTEDSRDTIHIVGSLDSERGKVSSPIDEYDEQEDLYKCITGCYYKLVGEPGSTANTEFVFNQWDASIAIHTLEDITDEFRRN